MKEYEVNLPPQWPFCAAKGLEIMSEEQAARFCTMVQMELGSEAPIVGVFALFTQWVKSDSKAIKYNGVASIIIELLELIKKHEQHQKREKMNEYEVNLSPLLGIDLWPFSGSVVTHGVNAGERTWLAAQNAAKGLEILTDAQAARFYTMMQGSGMELGTDTPKVELVALFLQWVTSDLREIGCDAVADLLELDEMDESNFFVTDGVPHFQIY